MRNYTELLKDPRWQKKRLEIFAMDHWECRCCGSKTGTLNVHHNYYTKGAMPWEYDDSAFITLCDRCHEKAHHVKWQQAFLDLNLSPQGLLDIALVMKYQINQYKKLVQPVLDKYQTRVTPEWIGWEAKLFESIDEVEEMCDWRREEKKRYNG